MYSRDQLFTFCRYDDPPARFVRKAIFSHHLWLPERSRRRWQRIQQKWRTQPVSSSPIEPSRVPTAVPDSSAVKSLNKTIDSVSFGLLNAQSLGNKFTAIAATVTEAAYDVLLLTETWHTASEDVALRRCLPDGYSCIDAPRPTLGKSKPCQTNHGGIAAIVSDRLTSKTIRLSSKPATFEHLCFSVTGSATTIIILVIYRPGSTAVTDTFFTEFSTVLETVALYKCQVVITGDLNIRVDHPDSRDAHRLSEIIDSFDCIQHIPHVPTHRNGGTLDLVITKSDDTIQCVSVDPPDIISDHSLISWRLPLLQHPPISADRKVRSWKNLDRDEFRAALLDSDLCKPDHQCTTPDEFFCVYNDVLQSLADKFAPLRKVAVTRRQRLAVWHDEECRMLRRHSRRLERRFRKSQLLSDRRLWVEHERERHRVYRRKETGYWNQQFVENANQPRKLWKTVQSVLGSSSNGRQKGSVLTADDLLKFFNTKVEGVRQSTGNTPVQSFLPPAPAVLEEYEPCSTEEVLKVINSSSAKSCALDPVPTDILKAFLPYILPFVTDMCNASLRHGDLPVSQRHALVVPRLKKANADPTDAKNYRPVSNLSFMSKVIERLVCKQLVSFLAKHGLIPAHQSAYRPAHSTETAVLKIVSDVLMAADRGEVTLLGLLDLSAAFDTVDHDILLARLSMAFGIRSSALSWIQSFLQGRTQTVLFAGLKSVCSPVTCGVPQGSVLGPILFLLYTADVEGIVRRHGLGMHSYADDVQLYLHTPPPALADQSTKLALCISDLNSWMTSNRLKLNTDKTQFLCAGTRQQLDKVSMESIVLDGVNIDLSDEVTLLGVVIDSRLTFVPHIRRLVGRCFYHLRQLRTIRRSLTPEAVKTLVHSLITSRIDYCNGVLSGVPAVHLRQLQSVLNAAARLITRKQKFDHISETLRDLHWLPIKERINYKLCLTVYKCLHHLAPDYLIQLCTRVAAIPSRSHLRSASHSKLNVPRTNTKTFGPRSFAIAGPTIWNSLKPDICDEQLSVGQFRNRLKTEFFRRADFRAS